MAALDDDDIIQLRAFLDEDLGRGDITTEALVYPDTLAVGEVRCGERGVAAGIAEAAALAELAGLECTRHCDDGADLLPGSLALDLSGSAARVLGVERTLLNLLGHLSGVATLTRTAVAAVAESFSGANAMAPPRVSATRKTLPGLRRLQKRAVVAGGGDPHRHDLSEAVLIKDNHLSIVGGVAAAIAATRSRLGAVAIEIEVETRAEAEVAAEKGAERLLLDNMTPAQIVEIVDRLTSRGLRDNVVLEASGGINLATIGAYADTGVDVISMGMLTASVPQIDYSLHFRN